MNMAIVIFMATADWKSVVVSYFSNVVKYLIVLDSNALIETITHGGINVRTRVSFLLSWDGLLLL